MININIISNIVRPTEAGSGIITLSLSESYGDLLFDQDRVYGYDQYLSGNLIIDLTGVSTETIILVYHRDMVKPSYTGATVVETGDYVEGVLNIIRLSYNGATVDVAYHAQV